MHAHWRYTKYLARHKWYVFLACLRLGWRHGCPGLWWRGLTHDLSKLRPSEWFPYVQSFYGGPHRPWAEVSSGEKYFCFDAAWATCKEGVQEAFDRAWLAHQHRSRHHWQHWLLVQDDDPSKVLVMGYADTLEMVADWIGAGRACGTPDTRAWYEAHKTKMQLHPDTCHLVEELLGMRP